MFKECIMTPMSDCLGFKDFLFPLWHIFWFLRVYTREPDSPDLNLPLPSCEHGQTTYLYLHYCCLLCKMRLTAVTSKLLWRFHERQTQAVSISAWNPPEEQSAHTRRRCHHHRSGFLLDLSKPHGTLTTRAGPEGWPQSLTWTHLVCQLSCKG